MKDLLSYGFDICSNEELEAFLKSGGKGLEKSKLHTATSTTTTSGRSFASRLPTPLLDTMPCALT